MKRCLIVDDSRVIRRVAAKIIQDLGFEVEEAENGKKALEACRTRMPDLALIDMDMPVMDGRTYLRELRGLPGGDKVVAIFCTTDADSSNEFILKPFDSDIVRSKFLLLDIL
jgi:two-component system chemotaxis response regulator CheY